MKRIIPALMIILLVLSGCGSSVSDNAVETAVSVDNTVAVSNTEVVSADTIIEEVIEEPREDIVITKSVSEDEFYEEFSFSRIPLVVDDLESISKDYYDDPYFSAALAIIAFANYENNPEDTIKMAEYLNGTEGLTDYEKELYNGELKDREYKPFSYMAGATPENYYTPDEPYVIRIYGDKFTWVLEGRVKLFAYTSGSEKPRAINVRYDEQVKRWCVYEHGILGYMKEPGYTEAVEEDTPSASDNSVETTEP